MVSRLPSLLYKLLPKKDRVKLNHKQLLYLRTHEPMLGNSLVWMLFQVSHIVCTADGKFCIIL